MDKCVRDLHALLSNEAYQWASSNSRVARRVRKVRDAVRDMARYAAEESWHATCAVRLPRWLRAEEIVKCIVDTPDRDPLLGSVANARRRALLLWREIAADAISHTTGRCQRRYTAEVGQVERMVRL
jgi:hypothetical protein